MIFNYFKTNKALKKELKEVKIMLEEERDIAIDNASDLIDLEESSTPERVIMDILGEKLKWFDPKGMGKEEQREYYADAHNLLRSEVFKNEINGYVKQLVEGIAKGSKNFEEVVALRYSINGVQALKERIQMIGNPDAIKGPTTDNINDAL